MVGEVTEVGEVIREVAGVVGEVIRVVGEVVEVVAEVFGVVGEVVGVIAEVSDAGVVTSSSPLEKESSSTLLIHKYLADQFHKRCR